jgi:hypothetical protein
MSKLCMIETCESNNYSYGYCIKHYRRYQKYGDPLFSKQEDHGMSYSREWKTYDSMKGRCCRPNDPSYKDYGGRGIRVCDRWLHSFKNFYEDMGARPEGYTLDRKDVNGDYEKSNCRWASYSLQNINKRSRSNTGITGITQRPNGKYEVTCRNKYLGKFLSLEDAKTARQQAITLAEQSEQ